MNRALAGPQQDDLQTQLAAAGLKPDGPLPAEEEFPIMPDMIEPFELFTSLATQWRLAPDGLPVGLDYAAARAACEFLGLAPSRQLLSDLRWLEAGALDALNERRA